MPSQNAQRDKKNRENKKRKRQEAEAAEIIKHQRIQQRRPRPIRPQSQHGLGGNPYVGYAANYDGHYYPPHTQSDFNFPGLNANLYGHNPAATYTFPPHRSQCYIDANMEAEMRRSVCLILQNFLPLR